MNQLLQQKLRQELQAIDDKKTLSEIADNLEQLVREIRRAQLSAHEKEMLDQIRACYQAQGRRSYFNQKDLPDTITVNLVNLDALHWIEKLPEAQASTFGFTDHSGIPYHDANERYNQKMRFAWRNGTPYRVTTYGKLSLANGYLFWGLSGREINEGFDGYNKTHPNMIDPD
ncbi:MAG: hypothetical protein WBC91_19815 [Phototrophicaceae bacterium]